MDVVIIWKVVPKELHSSEVVTVNPVRWMLFTPPERMDMVGRAWPFRDRFRDHRSRRGDLESEIARTLGYVSKAAIHPAQAPVINEEFTSSPEVFERQREVVAAFQEAQGGGRASIGVDRKSVDSAVARAARIIARAEAAWGKGDA